MSEDAIAGLVNRLKMYEFPCSPSKEQIRIEGYLWHRSSSMSSHVRYVISRTYSGNQVQVYRRFSDFVELYNRLVHDCPFICIPMHPPRFFYKIDHPEIVDRMDWLQAFMTSILQHAVLSECEWTKRFLFLPSEEWQACLEADPEDVNEALPFQGLAIMAVNTLASWSSTSIELEHDSANLRRLHMNCCALRNLEVSRTMVPNEPFRICIKAHNAKIQVLDLVTSSVLKHCSAFERLCDSLNCTAESFSGLVQCSWGTNNHWFKMFTNGMLINLQNITKHVYGIKVKDPASCLSEIIQALLATQGAAESIERIGHVVFDTIEERESIEQEFENRRKHVQKLAISSSLSFVTAQIEISKLNRQNWQSIYDEISKDQPIESLDRVRLGLDKPKEVPWEVPTPM